MKKIDLAFIVIALLVAVVSYIGTNNMYIPIGLFVIYIAYYIIFIRKKFKIYLETIEKIHCCYHFINSFIITMSVKESLEDAYQNGIRLGSKALKEETSEIENMPVYERIVFLRKYFNLAIYKMFVNIIDLYQEQGGNILTISDSLIRECTRVEKTLNESTSIGNKHLVEFGILWLLSFAILIFLRFAIARFYYQMISSPIVLAMMVFFFIIFLVCLHVFLSRFVNLTIKEDVEE